MGVSPGKIVLDFGLVFNFVHPVSFGNLDTNMQSGHEYAVAVTDDDPRG
jgi:hypothetical protein